MLTTHTGDHRTYHRQSLSIPPRRLDVASGVLSFLVKHDPARCQPFGLFLVLQLDPRGQRYIGAQLSNPTLDDCLRLARVAPLLHSMFRLDPTLPEEMAHSVGASYV